MAFVKINNARKYLKYAECSPGQKLVDAGIYVGPEEGKFGVQHVFKQQDGETMVLNSSGHLNYLLEAHVPAGKLVNVYYADKVMLTKGAFKGKEAHNFEIEIDNEYGKPQSRVTAPADALSAIATAPEIDDISL